MQALYGFLAVIGVVAAIFGLAFLGQLAARRQGAAEERAGAEADARAAEAEMTEIQSETITPEELRKRIRDGTFGGQT